MWKRILSLLYLLPSLATVSEGLAAKVFPGPVEASVVKVIDGDTFLADISIWPGHTLRMNVRIRGVDAPETKARCNFERRAAQRARDALTTIMGDGQVLISDIAGAKYHGRVLADVLTTDGKAVGPHLLQNGLVRPYEGGRRKPWCR